MLLTKSSFSFIKRKQVNYPDFQGSTYIKRKQVNYPDFQTFKMENV